MFRKLLITSVTALGLASTLALPAVANAHEFRHEHRHGHHHGFRVYYRDPCRPDWVFAGTFSSHSAAEGFAAQFGCRGFAISIR